MYLAYSSHRTRPSLQFRHIYIKRNVKTPPTEYHDTQAGIFRNWNYKLEASRILEQKLYVQAVTNVQKKYHNRNELQRQAYVPLPMSTSLSILSTSGLSAKFLRTRHHRLRCGSSSHAMRSSAAADGDHAGLSGIRCASLASAATHAFAPLQRAAPRRRAMPRRRRVRRF